MNCNVLLWHLFSSLIACLACLRLTHAREVLEARELASSTRYRGLVFLRRQQDSELLVPLGLLGFAMEANYLRVAECMSMHPVLYIRLWKRVLGCIRLLW